MTPFLMISAETTESTPHDKRTASLRRTLENLDVHHDAWMKHSDDDKLYIEFAVYVHETGNGVDALDAHDLVRVVCDLALYFDQDRVLYVDARRTVNVVDSGDMQRIVADVDTFQPLGDPVGTWTGVHTSHMKPPYHRRLIAPAGEPELFMVQ